MAVKRDERRVTIIVLGSIAIYSPIIPETKNIGTKAETVVIVPDIIGHLKFQTDKISIGECGQKFDKFLVDAVWPGSDHEAMHLRYRQGFQIEFLDKFEFGIGVGIGLKIGQELVDLSFF